jgi:hypothetical protein
MPKVACHGRFHPFPEGNVKAYFHILPHPSNLLNSFIGWLFGDRSES